MDWRDFPPVHLETGDLVFRRGQGMWTRFFINASSREKRFSHVGLVVSNETEAVIIHADADDSTGIGQVRLQDWRGFFSNALECAVYRRSSQKTNPQKYAVVAMKYIGVPFDSSFDTSNTNRLYCTELIKTVIDQVEGQYYIGNTKGFGHYFIAIDDLYHKGFLKIFDSEETRSKEPLKRNR